MNRSYAKRLGCSCLLSLATGGNSRPTPCDITHGNVAWYSKAKLQGQLSHSWVDGSDADGAKGQSGWPKNILHWKGIQESILDLCATVPIHFVIADGIVAMEGNGPLNGTPRPLGKIVLADDPVAADATCARLMGFEPGRIAHIHEGSRFMGNAHPVLIDEVGETFRPPTTPFQVVQELQSLRHQ